MDDLMKLARAEGLANCVQVAFNARRADHKPENRRKTDGKKY